MFEGIDMKNDLKKLSLSAKQRLKSGFWSEKKSVYEGVSYSAFMRAVNKQPPTEEELEFRNKVLEILDSQDEIADPIGKLIDRDYYEHLDYSARQKYIFNLAERFRSVSEAIKNERGDRDSSSGS